MNEDQFISEVSKAAQQSGGVIVIILEYNTALLGKAGCGVVPKQLILLDIS